MLSQLFAGAGLGILVGLLVGLSASPVVSAVVGALATALVTLLGFARAANAANAPGSAQQSVVRLTGFGFACAGAVLLGLVIRTHNWLSPSVADQVAQVRKAGYSAEEARQWVAYKNVGAPFTNAAASERTKSNEATSSVLFAAANSGECQYFDTSRFANVHEQLNALNQQGGKYAEYAEKISILPLAEQKTVLNALKLLYCPH